MVELTYKCRNRLHFDSEQDFFITLGVLANNRYTQIVDEQNQEQGAWSHEYRIHVMEENDYLKFKPDTVFTEGVGNILYRVQCVQYIQYLIDHFEIVAYISRNMGIEDRIQNSEHIRNIVCTRYPQFLEDFDRGYNS